MRVSLCRQRTSLDRLLQRRDEPTTCVFERDTFLGDALTALLLSRNEQARGDNILLTLRHKRFLVWWHDRVRVGGRWRHRRYLRDCLDMMSTPLGHFSSFSGTGAGICITMPDDSEARDRICWFTAPDNLERLLAWNQQCDTTLYRRLSAVIAPLISIGNDLSSFPAWRDLWEELALGRLCLRFHWLHWGRVYALLRHGAASSHGCALVPDLMRRVATLYREFHLGDATCI